MNTARNILAILGIVLGLLFTAWFLAGFFAADANASDGYCTTDRMSGMSFTLCRYTNPWQPSLEITCVDNQDYCTTTTRG